MTRNFIKSLSIAGIFALALTSCQSEENMPMNPNKEAKTVKVTAIASVGDQTRTDKPMNEKGGLDFKWSANDQVVVISEDGSRNLGILTVAAGNEGHSTAILTGNLLLEEGDSKANIYYLGKNAKVDATMKFDYTVDISSQKGTNASITEFDIMRATSDLAFDEDGDATLEFNLSSVLSLAHFYLNLPAGVTGSGDVTINGQNIANKVTIDFATGELRNMESGDITVGVDWTKGNSNEGDIFMMVVPNTNVVTSFTLGLDEKSYQASLKERTYTANKIFNGGTEHGKDVYFTEDGNWTLTYMNGEDQFKVDTANDFGPSYSFTIISDVPTNSDVNKEFKGWSETANGSVAYISGQTLTLNRPVTTKTLYAVWEQRTLADDEYFTIYAWRNDGTTGKETVVEYQKGYPHISYLEDLDIPEREGYKFKGWSMAADSNVTVETVTFNYPEKVKNVYAVWEKDSSSATITSPDAPGTGY